MVVIYFMSPEDSRHETKEFKTWKEFYVYVLEKWPYDAYDFWGGVTRLANEHYRFHSTELIMLIKDTRLEDYNRSS